MSERRKVVAWARLSTEEQASEGKAGLERQLADIERLAVTQNVEVVHTYKLIGVSGTDTIRHPDLRAMNRELAKPEIAGCLTSAVDRLVRPDKYSDFGVFDGFQTYRKRIWSANEGEIDPSSNMGFLNTLLLGGKAGMERKDILQRVGKGKEILRKQGRHTTNPKLVPRGVKYTRGAKGQVGTWEYVEPYASRIVKACDRILKGDSLSSVAKTAGYANSTALKNALRNPIWIGIRRYALECTGPEFHRGDRKCHAIVPRQTPLDVDLKQLCGLKPLISVERWNAVQQTILRSRESWVKTNVKQRDEFLCTGILVCGKCGRPYYTDPIRRGKKVYDRYYCSSAKRDAKPCGVPAVRRDLIDPFLERSLAERLLNPKVILAVLAGARKAQPAVNVRKIEAEIQRLEQRLKLAYEDRLSFVITREQYLAEKDASEAKLRELEALRPQSVEQQSDAKQLAKQIAHVFAEFEMLRWKDKKDLLRRAVRRITVENQMLLSITLKGGFLGELGVRKMSSNLCALTQIPNTPRDLVLDFPKPIPLAGCR